MIPGSTKYQVAGIVIVYCCFLTGFSPPSSTSLLLVVIVVNVLFIYDLSNFPSSPSHANFIFKYIGCSPPFAARSQSEVQYSST